MAGLLGDDGLGYELAKKLESQGVWKTWLGDSLYYSNFIHFLSSPISWNTFMRTNNNTNTSSSSSSSYSDSNNTNNKIQLQLQLQLQLRVRALLFDKASATLYTPLSSNHNNISNLNPNYLELHGDDVYFTFENSGQDAALPTANTTTSSSSSKGQYKTNSDVGEMPENWYTQFFEKYRASKSYRLMFSDRESEKRTPEQMSTYLRVLENHKKRRVVFKDNSSNHGPNLITGDDVVDDELFFPETMFTLNCVPDGAVMRTSEPENNQKMQLNGIFDNLPPLMNKSPAINPIMIERLGIRPEYLNMEQQQGNRTRGKDNGFEGKKKLIGQEQAAKMSQKVVARLLANAGFESSSVAVTEILGQLLTSHINKLGGKLKLLSDSYRKQCSAIDLLKMFLQTSGYRNLVPLVELVKDNTRNMTVQQTQQVHGILSAHSQQPTLQQQQQNLIRQMNPQMQQQQQINNPQYVAFQQLQQQQQLERMRRRQQQLQQQQLLQQQQQQQQQSITPRPAGMNPNIMNMDKDNRPLVQVKMENSEVPLDANNTFTGMNSRHPQLQHLRQQQLAAISSLHAQANNNPFRQMNPVQLQQMQSMNMGMARAQPVKVEGFQELMGGGDSSMKHDSDDNKLLSPK